MVGARGVLRKALFSRGVPSRLVAVRGLLYMIVQQLRDLDENDAEDALLADPEMSLSQVTFPSAMVHKPCSGLAPIVLLVCTAFICAPISSQLGVSNSQARWMYTPVLQLISAQILAISCYWSPCW